MKFDLEILRKAFEESGPPTIRPDTRVSRWGGRPIPFYMMGPINPALIGRKKKNNT